MVKYNVLETNNLPFTSEDNDIIFFYTKLKELKLYYKKNLQSYALFCLEIIRYIIDNTLPYFSLLHSPNNSSEFESHSW